MEILHAHHRLPQGMPAAYAIFADSPLPAADRDVADEPFE
jgi:hypothetical protein